MVDVRLEVLHERDVGLHVCEHGGAELSVEIPFVESRLPDYGGPYEATPSRHEQVFATAGKTMQDDFTVVQIPYYTTTNVGGGYTAIISEE